MLYDDTYNTIRASATGLYKEKGSKFLAFAEPVINEDEAKAILEKYRKQFHDARHHCFAWAIGFTRESQRMNDDGEPAGTAGRPIFGQILSFDLTNLIIIVIRYFGGTKLGVGGLINAYRTAAKTALESADIEAKTVNEVYKVVFAYPETNEVMRIIKEKDIDIIGSHYTDICQITISIRKSNALSACESLSIVNNLIIKYIKTI
jgi:uncharacterized YigZ family protein